VTAWEYKTVNGIERFGTGRIDEDALRTFLNQEGAEGWELVNVYEPPTTSVFISGPTLLIFKRPLSST
jgi:hypothetical protein